MSMEEPVPVVEDEVALLESMVPLRSAAVLELGCGSAQFARGLVERTAVASVRALEVDPVQHRLNLDASRPLRLSFGLGAAEEIAHPDASFDGVVMMKSLHHVPVEAMDRALREVRRVLKPGGWFYVSEPVYAGELNDILRLFHDEGRVRALAYEALQRASRDGVLEWVEEKRFEKRAFYKDYDDFVARHVRSTHTRIDYPDAIAEQVRAKLAAFMTPAGAAFAQPIRVNLLRRPTASGSARTRAPSARA